MPPTPISTGSTGEAHFAETGILAQVSVNGNTTITRTILTTIKAGSESDSLVASGGVFTMSFVVSGSAGDTILLYRSADGNSREANSPSTSCTLNEAKQCTFTTNHLSYFTTIKEISVTVIPPSAGGG